MKLVSYQEETGFRPGLVKQDRVFDIGRLAVADDELSAWPHATIRELLVSFGDSLPALGKRLSAVAGHVPGALVGNLANLRLGPPVTDPQKVLCVGLNYRNHVTETKRELPKHPDIFSKFATSLVGYRDDLAIGTLSPKLDYEGELAVVIGTPCRNVSRQDATAHIAGAMILNDTSARDLQFNGTQWLPGKAIDNSTPCGPYLVTLDEVGPLDQLELTTRVNGTVVQNATTDRLIFDVPTVIAYISQFLELLPGDVITTGTPEGIGSRREPPSFLTAGDVVEVEISQLGVLHNTIR